MKLPFSLPDLCLQSFQRRNFWSGILAIAFGCLMGLTAAPSPFWWLAWVGLVPLWAWVRTLRWKQAAVIGGCWGLGYYGTILSWLLGLHPLTWLGLSWTASLSIAIFSWLFVTLWGSALPLVWAVCFAKVSPFLGTVGRVVSGATLWCALESLWARSPLWWPDLVNSQSPHNLAFAHLGQLSGLTTLTVVLLLVNGLLAEALLTRHAKLVASAVGLGLVAHLLGWGLMQSASFSVTPASASRPPPVAGSPVRTALRIGIVQGNIPTRLKLSASGVKQSVAVYRHAYLDLAQQGVDAVLLPEGALPFLWGQSPQYDAAILSAVDAAQIPLWAGTFVPTQQSYTQSLISVTPHSLPGAYSGRYNKVKLVPLGEYLPFSSVLSTFIQRLSPIQLGMVAGSTRQIFETAFGQATVAICYESAFPELLRRQTASGGRFILSIANNDPFNGRMLAQHHALDVLRAIENHRWLVRATNTGLSAVITPQGQTQWQSVAHTQVTHIAQIQPLSTQTLYVKYGNWLLPTLILSSLTLAFLDQRKV